MPKDSLPKRLQRVGVGESFIAEGLRISIYLSFFPSVYLSIYKSSYMCVCVCTCVYIYIYIFLFIYLYTCMDV